MRSAVRSASSVLLAGLFLAGCSPKLDNGSTGSPGTTPTSQASATGMGGASGAAIAIGAGPPATYTGQQQPAAGAAPRARYTAQHRPQGGSCHYRYENGRSRFLIRSARPEPSLPLSLRR